jgi:hypothetical protein
MPDGCPPPTLESTVEAPFCRGCFAVPISGQDKLLTVSFRFLRVPLDGRGSLRDRWGCTCKQRCPRFLSASTVSSRRRSALHRNLSTDV